MDCLEPGARTATLQGTQFEISRKNCRVPLVPLAKVAKLNEASAPVGSVPKDSEGQDKRPDTGSANKTDRVCEMEQEILDLKITNRAKDQVIDHFRAERKQIIDQLLNASRRVGELETKLLQLDGPSRPRIGFEQEENRGQPR